MTQWSIQTTGPFDDVHPSARDRRPEAPGPREPRDHAAVPRSDGPERTPSRRPSAAAERGL